MFNNLLLNISSKIPSSSIYIYSSSFDFAIEQITLNANLALLQFTSCIVSGFSSFYSMIIIDYIYLLKYRVGFLKQTYLYSQLSKQSIMNRGVEENLGKLIQTYLILLEEVKGILVVRHKIMAGLWVILHYQWSHLKKDLKNSLLFLELIQTTDHQFQVI